MSVTPRFQAGCIQNCIEHWEQITSDKRVLDIVQGYKIEFDAELPLGSSNRRKVFSDRERPVILKEIDKLLDMGAIEIIEQESAAYVSPIFTIPKKDGTTRMILNLKSFNQSVEYIHFKMDTLVHAVSLMTPGCWMASIDLRNAYLSVPIHADHQKYLVFQFEEKFYKYKCLPFGLASAPRVFTKVLKPIFTTLREWGHIVLGYIDDTLLVAEEPLECERAVSDAVELLERLGFVVHEEKSVFVPSQCITFLGFILDSRSMTVVLTPEKVVGLREKCENVLTSRKISIREVASVVGSLVAACPGLDYGMIYVKPLEIEKNKALKESKGNFEAFMLITAVMKTCLE